MLNGCEDSSGSEDGCEGGLKDEGDDEGSDEDRMVVREDGDNVND